MLPTSSSRPITGSALLKPRLSRAQLLRLVAKLAGPENPCVDVVDRDGRQEVVLDTANPAADLLIVLRDPGLDTWRQIERQLIAVRCLGGAGEPFCVGSPDQDRMRWVLGGVSDEPRPIAD